MSWAINGDGLSARIAVAFGISLLGVIIVGSAHHELMPNGKQPQSVEMITLSLTFDHRVVNGAGAANFVHDIKELIEGFIIPRNTAVSAVT